MPVYELGDCSLSAGGDGDDESWLRGAFGPGAVGVVHVLAGLVLIVCTAALKHGR